MQTQVNRKEAHLCVSCECGSAGERECSNVAEMLSG